MDRPFVKTCMIMLVVSGLSSYVYCQDTARTDSQDVGGVSPSAGNLGSPSGEAGEKQHEALRDPFWPVGYTPSTAASPAGGFVGQETLGDTDPESHEELDLTGLSDEEQAIIRAHVKVGGILVQKNECIAIINSQLVRQGDDLTVLTDRRLYKFMIRSLTPDRIVLDSVNEQVREEGQNP